MRGLLRGGFFNFANALTALEPYNYPCRVIGFDTFAGNSSLTDRDSRLLHEDHLYAAPILDDLRKAIDVFDADRPLGHLPKLELIPGDLVETAPAYMADNPGTLWRIVCLSVNVFEPSVAAIKAFWPRLQAGGVLAFHGLNHGNGIEAIEAAFAELGEPTPSFQVHDYWPASYFATHP